MDPGLFLGAAEDEALLLVAFGLVFAGKPFELVVRDSIDNCWGRSSDSKVLFALVISAGAPELSLVISASGWPLPCANTASTVFSICPSKCRRTASRWDCVQGGPNIEL